MDMTDENARRIAVRDFLEKRDFSLTNARKKSDEFKTSDGNAIYFFWTQGGGANIAIDPRLPFDSLIAIPGVEFSKKAKINGLRDGTSMSQFPKEYQGFRPENEKSKIGRMFVIEQTSLPDFICALLDAFSGKSGTRRESVDYQTRITTADVVANSSDLSIDSEAEDRGTDRSGSQGYESDPEMRRVVEQHAVSRAIRFYERNGYTVKEFGKPFDLLCLKGDEVVHVEVKGSRMKLDSVSLTVNEVSDAENATWQSDLFVVDQIKVSNSGEALVPTGGISRVIRKWIPAREMLTPTEFRYQLPDECHWSIVD